MFLNVNRVVTHSFDCGIGLLFDQASLTCQDAINVDCSLSPTFYHLNDPSLRPGSSILSCHFSLLIDPFSAFDLHTHADLEVVDVFQSMKEKRIP